jgi:maleate isomerase
VSCTNLRTAEVIEDAEARLGKPVISSNQALFWHIRKLAGLPVANNGLGRLFAAD